MPGRRGQLLLIAGLGIAVVLVVLAIVLNTVIFTQNLATREAVDTRSPVEFTSAVDHGLGGAMTHANVWTPTNYTTLDDEFRRAVSTWAGNATRFGAMRGLSTDVQLHATRNGTRIVQPANATWTNANDDTDWTMATDVTDARRFHANVSRTSLPVDDGSNLAVSTVFRVTASDGTDSWTMYVYRNASDTDFVNVTVAHPDGTESTCSADGNHVELDVTDATLDGTDCAFSFASGVSAPYDVTVSEGDAISARYTLVVDREQAPLLGDLPSNTYHGQAIEESPFTAPAIYSAAVNVTADRADVRYTNNFTIVPDRVPGGETYHVASRASARELVYVNRSTGALSSVDRDGTVTTYGISDPAAIGPKHADLDGDGDLEVPFVDTGNTLHVIDENDASPTAITGDVNITNTVLAVGTWNGDTGISYVNDTDGTIYHVDTTSLSATQVTSGGTPTSATSVLGIVDVNGDGDTDVLYVDENGDLAFVDDGSSNAVGVAVATDPGVGGGAARDHTRDGAVRTPYVTTGDDVALVDQSGTTETLATGVAVQTPVAAFDVTGDDRLEVVYVDSSTNELAYVTLDGATGTVSAGGSTVQVDESVGVA